jgi:tight adherence protein B
MITPSYVLLEYAGFAVAGAGAVALTYDACARPTGVLHRGASAYIAWIDARLKSLLLPPRGTVIFVTQLAVAYLVAMLAVLLRSPPVALAIVLVGLAPWIAIDRAHVKRVARIEAQTDGFMTALANALKSTPSTAHAFASLSTIVSEPLRSEIKLATKQMHVGCTFENALLLMGTRIGSRTFDTAISTLLIAQRVGGNVPSILERSAAAIRELARLEGMVRGRTASGRVQMIVIAIAPIFFVLGFDRSDPHFYDPLFTTAVGRIALIVALLSWVFAIVLGRRILRVDF